MASDLHELVREAHHLVEGMEILKEDARRLYRYMKRSEVLVSDLKPYAVQPQLGEALAVVEGELAAVKRMLEDCAAKGKLAAYMQADHMLACFTAATRRIETALGNLPLHLLPNVTDTAEDIASLRTTLQRTIFALPEAHKSTLVRFRAACEAVKAHAAVLEEQVKSILQSAAGERALSRSEFTSVMSDLQREIRTLRAYAVAAAVDSNPGSTAPSAGGAAAAPATAAGSIKTAASAGSLASEKSLPRLDSDCGPTLTASAAAEAEAAAAAAMELRAPGAETRESAEASAYYLRILLDVVKAAHDGDEENVPLEFLCPLSTLIMQDPVVLMESGHSFERQALEDWWANGHRMCPKTGIPLKSKHLAIASNVQLKEAIHRWAEAGDMSLRFRPLLRLLGTASDASNPSRGVAEALNAAALSGRLEAALGISGGGASAAGSAAASAGGAAPVAAAPALPVANGNSVPAAAPAAPALTKVPVSTAAAEPAIAVAATAAPVAAAAAPADPPKPPLQVGGGMGTRTAPAGSVADRMKQWQ